MERPRNSNLLNNARRLRKTLTKEERHLWFDFLRYCRPRFRRQEIVGNYIADFYCHQAKLIIELDGSQHYAPTTQNYDAQRTAYFESLGIQVLRYSNAEIALNFKGVCQHILQFLDRAGQHPSVTFGDSSPQGEP